MENLLLIRTSQRLFSTPSIAPPLGLMYIAANIQREFAGKYNIKIIDIVPQRMSLKAIKKIIYDFKPVLIGCSVLSNEHHIMNELADVSKGIDRQIRFIVGGPHSTMYYDEVLKNKNIDIAVIGEGEHTICDLLRYLNDIEKLAKIPGIAYRNRDKIVLTPRREYIKDLNNLPFPSWNLIDCKSYSKLSNMPMNTMIAGKRYMAILTSRGCPYQCTYCHNIFGKNFRKRSAENVMKEILELYHNYNIDEFQIFDDIFNLDVERAKKICELIISSGIKIKIAFPNGIRGDIIDGELLTKLKLAGAYSITFALESASPRIQKLIKKNIDISKLNKLIESADRQKLFTRCFFMLGFPTETVEEIKETINFACESKLLTAGFFIVWPQRNTELFEQVNKLYPNFKMNFQESNYLLLPNLHYEKEVAKLPLVKLQILAYIKFLSSPVRAFKVWLRIPRKIFLLRNLIFNIRAIGYNSGLTRIFLYILGRKPYFSRRA